MPDAFDESYDVLIAGGGVAGVAAALAAARMGARTALVDKTVLLGGLATSGLVNIYLPLCDGNGRQVTFGIAEELLHASLRYGPGDVPAGWRNDRGAPEAGRYRAVFAPAAFALALDELAEQAGVALWLDTLVAGVRMDGDAVAGLEVETKAGRGLLHAAVCIDATGDADVAHRAGAPCETGRNALAMWALGMAATDAPDARPLGPAPPPIEMLRLGPEAGEPTDEQKAASDGLGPREITEFVLAGRRRLRQWYRDAQAAGDRATTYPVALPTMPQLRTTRRIVGRANLADGMADRPAGDSIGLVADWRRPGPVWEIPFGTLVPTGVRRLLAAGRCIASAGDAWEVTRVIPAAALTGQAAGTAAALSLRHDSPPDALAPPAVQAELRRQGVRLHREDVGL